MPKRFTVGNFDWRESMKGVEHLNITFCCGRSMGSKQGDTFTLLAYRTAAELCGYSVVRSVI